MEFPFAVFNVDAVFSILISIEDRDERSTVTGESDQSLEANSFVNIILVEKTA